MVAVVVGVVLSVQLTKTISTENNKYDALGFIENASVQNNSVKIKPGGQV